MSKHTPGPWARNFQTVRSESGKLVAMSMIQSFDNFSEEPFYNAQLIAAAPDLLVVAELQDIYDETEGFYFQKQWFEKGEAKRKLFELRKVAIAKAKGIKQ